VAGNGGVAAASTGRNRYVDLLRVGAIGFVVLGHWLVTSITYRGGLFQGEDVLTELPWTQWLTLGFQVMPVFFLVGGMPTRCRCAPPGRAVGTGAGGSSAGPPGCCCTPRHTSGW